MSKVAIDGSVLTYNVADVGGSAITGGTVFEGANACFVWQDDYAADGPGAYIWFGAVTLDKETGVVFTKGDQLYWDATNDNLDKTITNIPIGIAAEDAATGATSAKVLLGIGSGDA